MTDEHEIIKLQNNKKENSSQDEEKKHINNNESYDSDDDDENDDDDDKENKSDSKTNLNELKKKAKIKSIHGVHPKNLIEKITRIKIQSHPYWKEKCIGLNEESLVDRAMALESFGGTFGGNKQPTHFLCLLLKMLQIQPDMDIIKLFITSQEFKYVRALGAFYLRLVGKPIDVYNLLDPLYSDFRVLRKKTDLGSAKVYIDQFIEELLTTNYSCDIALPHMPPRSTLIQQGLLKERESPLVDLNLIDLNKIEKEEYDKILKERSKSSSDATTTTTTTSLSSSSKEKERISDSKSNDDKRDDRKNDRRDDYKKDDGRDDYKRNDRKDDYRRDEYRRDEKRNQDNDKSDKYRRYNDDLDKRDSRRERIDYRDIDHSYDERNKNRERDNRYDNQRRDRDRDRYNDNNKRDRYRDDEEEEEGSISTKRKDETSNNKKKKDISKYEKSTPIKNDQFYREEKKNEMNEIDEMNALRAKLGLKPLK